MTQSPHFRFYEDPELPGWHRWELVDTSRFNAFLGPLWVRAEGGVARVRMLPEHRHSNFGDNIHGGATLGFIDVALFAAARGLGILGAGRAVTLDLSTQFIGAGRLGEPLEAEVELLRETGRLLFMRGLVVQGEAGSDVIASFTATVRKIAAEKPSPLQGRGLGEGGLPSSAAPAESPLSPTLSPKGEREQK